MALPMLRGALPVAAFLLLLATDARAQERRRPVRDAASANERFELRVLPGGAHRACRADLLEYTDGGRRRRVWRAELVNERAPMQALVRDDGAYVVTLDEFRKGGAANAVVVYDELGEVSAQFELDELLTDEDWRHVRRERDALEWLDGAETSFQPQDTFVIELAWGRRVVIDLIRGKLINALPAGRPPEHMAALLNADSASGDEGGDETSPGSAPADLSALTDAELFALLSQRPTQKLAETALERLLASFVPETAPATDEVPIPDASTDSTDSASPDAPFGIAVPLPDPADPVDYVSWLNEQTRVEGGGARPFYETAVEAYVPWSGDAELFAAAMAGDPAALGDPALLDWLDANRPALQAIAAGNDLPYHGFQMKSEDGTLVSVLLPQLGPIRQLSRAGVIEGHVRKEAGALAGAAESYLEVMQAGGQIGQGPTLIENLVGQAIDSLASDALFELLETADAATASTIAQRAADARTPRPMAENLQLERAMMMDMLQRVYRYDDASGRYTIDRDGIQLVSSVMSGTESANFIDQLKNAYEFQRLGFENAVGSANTLFDAYSRAAAAPYPESRSRMKAIEAEIGEHPNPLVRMLIPTVSRARVLEARSEAKRRALQVVASLRAYEGTQGAYPESLEELYMPGNAPTPAAAPRATSDPFTQSAFRYFRDGDTFVLYSPGINGVDDGGVAGERWDERDLVFWPRRAED